VTGLSVSLHLATRELWRNRGRFLLFSMVIALITVLVLFIAALARGWPTPTVSTCRSSTPSWWCLAIAPTASW